MCQSPTMDLPELSPEDVEFGWIELDWLWMEAAPAASADRESPHDANALALSPTARTMQAANLTKFRVWVEFIMLLLVKVGGHLWKLVQNDAASWLLPRVN